MSVMHARKRAAERMSEAGGGLTEESLTDTATDDDIEEHETGEGPAGMLGDVSLDYDDLYGEMGTRHEMPAPDTYTVEEVRHDASQYDKKSYDRADMVRDTAEIWQSGTVTLNPGADPYYLAGADQVRKRIWIKNASRAAAEQQVDVFVGNDASVSRSGGAGALLLQGGISNNLDGQDIELTSTGDVWIVPAQYSGVSHGPVTVTYLIERYAR